MMACADLEGSKASTSSSKKKRAEDNQKRPSEQKLADPAQVRRIWEEDVDRFFQPTPPSTEKPKNSAPLAVVHTPYEKLTSTEVRTIASMWKTSPRIDRCATETRSQTAEEAAASAQAVLRSRDSHNRRNCGLRRLRDVGLHRLLCVLLLTD